MSFLEDRLEFARVRPCLQHLWRWFVADRKTAAMVNRELLDWLSRRAQPERPFFAFLNYFDAHYPYQLPPGQVPPFRGHAEDSRQRALIEHWWDLDKTAFRRRSWRLPPVLMTIASPTSMSRSGSCWTSCGDAAFWSEPG